MLKKHDVMSLSMSMNSDNAWSCVIVKTQVCSTFCDGPCHDDHLPLMVMADSDFHMPNFDEYCANDRMASKLGHVNVEV